VTLLRRLDHVAVLVRSTDAALRFYEGRLGLKVHTSEEIDAPHVRLTYLDAGNAVIQLVEPLDAESPFRTGSMSMAKGCTTSASPWTTSRRPSRR
jgi:methylmalonyl-CoA/ethylmalonyl-CoA epimerase